MAKKQTKKTGATKLSKGESLTDEAGENNGGRSLVIVESPAKAKTLKKILGAGYQIKASVGHVRDLPKKKIGVDIENNFEPVYEVLEEKQTVVDDLREAARKSDRVYLAADPDREGEAIAWHVYTLLQKPDDQIFRIEFNEITKKAILDAIERPRPIDLNRVNAQQARRILDRLVGYKLSPLLWKKVTKGLSAGRVQSVAVRLICDREAEIEAFTAEEYWSITAQMFSEKDKSVSFEAKLVKVDGENIKDENKTTIRSEGEAKTLVKVLETNPYAVSAINIRESSRKPSPPFITSTLQREASTRFGYAVKRTMQIAQQLYEGIELGSEGPVGLITYMRTDSTRIADEAQAEAKDFILNRYGQEYYPETPNVYIKKPVTIKRMSRTPTKPSVLLTSAAHRKKLNPISRKTSSASIRSSGTGSWHPRWPRPKSGPNPLRCPAPIAFCGPPTVR
jgi:DNA topoisomerase I